MDGSTSVKEEMKGCPGLGTHYVRSVTYGAEMVASLKFKSSSSSKRWEKRIWKKLLSLGPCVLCQIACITGRLWAKRGERGILREARNECEERDEGGEKYSACYQSSVLALPTLTKWTLRSIKLMTRCSGMFVWQVCLQQNNRHAFMFFWRCCSRSCLRADVSYFLCCTWKRDDVPFPRATKEIGDVCTQAIREALRLFPNVQV